MSETLLDVGVDELDRLKIGAETNGLYWDGQRVQTESVIVLSPKQGRWAFLVGLAAIVTALAAVVSAYAAMRALDTKSEYADAGQSPVSVVCTTKVRVNSRNGAEQILSNQCQRMPAAASTAATQ